MSKPLSAEEFAKLLERQASDCECAECLRPSLEPIDAKTLLRIRQGHVRSHEVLTVARALVSQGWTTGCSARDASGGRVDPASSSAVAWCAMGAIKAARERIGTRLNGDYAEIYLGDASPGLRDVEHLNELAGTTKTEILAIFDHAIERARGEGR